MARTQDNTEKKKPNAPLSLFMVLFEIVGFALRAGKAI
jgi:hypothetical protein